MRTILLSFATILFFAAPRATATEPWADPALKPPEGLELWLDASVQNKPREAAWRGLLKDSGYVDAWFDGSGKGRHLSQRSQASQPRAVLAGSISAIRFDGKDDFLSVGGFFGAHKEMTVFVLAAPKSNAGFFRAMLSMSKAGQSDFTTGLNLDLGGAPSTQLDFINVEGAGFGGLKDMTQESTEFGKFHTFEVLTAPDKPGVALFFDSRPVGNRPRGDSQIFMEEIAVGARLFSNTGDPPFAQGFFDGDIAEVLVFSRALKPEERKKVEAYLEAKRQSLHAAMAERQSGRLLKTVENPPPVQMLVPGFTVHKLPVKLTNINNLRYRPDGKLFAVAYNGNVWLLSDTDGDGLEDKAQMFWENGGRVRSPIGMTLTPPGYKHGNGVIVTTKMNVSLIVDTDGDDKADKQIIIAEGWKESIHGVDALGAAIDKDGAIYFGLGTENFADGYLVDKETGKSRYDVKGERSTIMKIAPDFSKREIIATGIRFPVALAINRHGDVFCTDQEGATWLPNGNPLDELLHVQKGRHYGFPPRHPKHLPDVIDEPSTFDYGPQHQSTCGFAFNESVNGGPVFGPQWWEGDAIVTGESRGKLYRTKLVKTAAGYVAQNQIIACLHELTIDACVGPRGELVVATHSGAPDWGTGPTGEGTLYKIFYSDKEAPQPVLVWPASPTEVRIAFDRPLDPESLKNISSQVKIEYGRYVSAGDRFETMRPGYEVVDRQQSTPRFDLPVYSVQVSPDNRTLILTTAPHTQNVTYAVTLPRLGLSPQRGEIQQPRATPWVSDAVVRLSPERAQLSVSPLQGLKDGATCAPGLRPGLLNLTPLGSTLAAAPGDGLPQHPTMDLQYTLHGVQAEWKDEKGDVKWSGWLPHWDLEVSRTLTSGSADHDALWPMFDKKGEFSLATRINVANMLRPAVQPGAKLDFQYASREQVVFNIGLGEWRGVKTVGKNEESGSQFFTLMGPTGETPISLTLSYKTNEDERQRPAQLTRLLIPWAPTTAQPEKIAARKIPELEGGNWLRGREVFFSEQALCSKCHAVGGKGGHIGPDLSNLVHRDYTSVMRDIREPSAALNPDHLAYSVSLADGRVVVGVPRAGDAGKVIIGDISGNETVVAKDQVKTMQPLPVSIMPANLYEAIGPEKLRDLLTFLMTAPLEPAELEIPDAPPPRKRAEVDSVLKASDKPDAGEIKPMNILLVDGVKDHGPGEHDYPKWKKRWTTLLGLAQKVAVDSASERPTAQQIEKADVIVFYQHGTWDAERAKAMDAFLQRGGGLVYLHFAVDGRPDPEAFAQRLGWAWKGGNSKFRHGALDLKLTDHPITRGMKGVKFYDESYWNLVGDGKGVNVLASGVEDGADQPLIWTREVGKGRVFVSIPGHFTWTFDDPLFRILILRGMAWAAGQPTDRLTDLATVGARVEP